MKSPYRTDWRLDEPQQPGPKLVHRDVMLVLLSFGNHPEPWIGAARRVRTPPPVHQETGETPLQTATCPKRFSRCLQRSSSLSSDEARSAPRKSSVPASIVDAHHVTTRLSGRGRLGAPAA